MDLVSIIIPTYNRSEKIKRAIESALCQTYGNIEIIVIDDNANKKEEREKTFNIIESIGDTRIKYVTNEENLGGAETRNRGIEIARGKYIAFLDDDDEFLPTKIEKQMKLMKEKECKSNNVAMIYCYKDIIDKNGKVVYTSNVNEEGNCLFEHLKQCVETTSTWLCNKEAINKVGRFENVKAHQDNILLMKLLGAGYEIYRVPEVLLKFYLHEGNGITNKNKNYIEYTNELIEYKKKYYCKLNKKQIEEINYSNSKMLIDLYKKNRMKELYGKELKKVISKNKIRKHTVRMIFDYFKL